VYELFCKVPKHQTIISPLGQTPITFYLRYVIREFVAALYILPYLSLNIHTHTARSSKHTH